MPEWKKILILVVGLLEILIFSGTILGWTSLKLMLKREGIFEYKCGSGALSANSSQSPSSPNQTLAELTSSPALPPPALANFSLLFNFTINAEQDDNRKSSPSVAPNVNSLKRTIVIPFQSAQPFNQSFIYTLLRDSSVVLRSNRSDAQLTLFSDTLARKDNVSTLEQFIHLFMAENLEPAVSAHKHPNRYTAPLLTLDACSTYSTTIARSRR